MKEITLNDGPKRKRRRDRSRTESSRREGSREERHRRAEGLEQPQITPRSERSRREGSQGRPGRYEQQPVKPELPKKKHSRTPLIVAGIVVLIMVAVYLGFGVYYMDRFFPGTTVNGIDVSGKTVKEVENLVANQVQDYVLRVHEKDNKTEQIDGADIQFEYVSDGAAQQLKYSQNSFLWINAYFHPQEYTMTTPTVYNKAKLKEAMEKLDAFDSDKVTEPKDAYIDETSSGFEIVEEVEGNQLDEDKVYELLCQAVTDGKTEVNLEESDCYLKPKKTSDNKKLKKKKADLIVVSMHAGIEKTSVINDVQKTIAHYAVKKGANLVLGHHPHTLQGIEKYKGAYIVYSLANFCFGGNTNPADKDTMIFQQTFTFKNKKLKKTKDIKIIPCKVSSSNSINNYQPTPAKGAAKKRIIAKMNRFCKPYNLKFKNNGKLR